MDSKYDRERRAIDKVTERVVRETGASSEQARALIEKTQREHDAKKREQKK